jgi:hypothetical protein
MSLPPAPSPDELDEGSMDSFFESIELPRVLASRPAYSAANIT